MPKPKVIILKNRNLDALVRKFKAGRISVKEFAKRIQEFGLNPEFWLTASQMGEFVRAGNNSREGFKYNCYTDKKRGMFFQTVIKKAILAAINFAHSAILKHYDKNAFVYDDPRLSAIDEYMKEYIATNFKNSPGYKDAFMLKVLGIFLFLMKEDVYYRGRWLQILKEIPREYELTKGELKNIEEYH